MEGSGTIKKISFQECEEDVQHCYETSGANVVVNVEPRSTKTRGSSMVKLKSIVGYKWKQKNYPGHLIALHKDGKVVAYSFCVEGRGLIRVIHVEGSKRVLIKGYTDGFLDIQFSDSKDYILAAIDKSNLFIFKLQLSDDAEVMHQLVMKIISNPEERSSICDKISWCPYIPEFENNDDGISKSSIVWVRGNRFECYSVTDIVKNYSMGGEHKLEDLAEGIVKSYEDDRDLISHVCFSPDGTTLALSTNDGFIKFYQIYFHVIISRCLFNWNPQNGKKISSFFFLDDFTQKTGSLFWKYVVILFEDNSEVGVYDCDDWKILQSVKFKSTIGESLEFKSEIDRTSSYLILSDMTNRQMYVLQILKENPLGTLQNGDNKQQNGNDSSGKTISRVFVSSIAEFNLASSILSFVISNASVKRNKCPFSDNFLMDEMEEFDEDNNSVFCVALKLYLVIPEGVQECHILYQPALGDSAETLPESPIVSEVKTDVPPPSAQKSHISLLTPEAFSSPIEKQSANASLNSSQSGIVKQEVLTALMMLASKTPQAANNSLENIVNIPNCNMIESEKIVQQKLASESIAIMKSCAASGGSSPSREVRDILLQADSVNEDYYPGEDSEDDKEIAPEKTKEVLNALNSIDVDFKNIVDEDDEDDEDEYEGVISSSDDEIDTKAKPESQNWPQAPQFIDTSSAGHATSKEVEVLSKRMNQMIEIMETQSGYLAELRSEIYNLRTGVQFNHSNLMSVENNCKKSVEDCTTSIEGKIMLTERRQTELLEKNFRKLESTTRNQSEIIEKAIKDNITNITTSKPYIDHLSQVMLNSIQKTLEQSLKKSMEQLIPSFEKVSNEMLKEIGKVFSTGTKEYTRAFEQHVKQYAIVQFQMNEFTNALHEIPAKTDEIMKNAFVPIFTRHHFDLKSHMDKTEEKILREVRDLVKNEIQKGFERQAVNLEESVLSVVQRSHCETPAPTIIFDQKEQIKQLLAHGEINAAFHQTLVSSDLTLLEYTIEYADFNKIFDPCPLEQSVLLSLIQQLTADMTKFNDIKLRYLSSAVMSLNENNPIIKEHAPKILKELYSTLNTFRQVNPNSSLAANLKMVMFVVQQMVQTIE